MSSAQPQPTEVITKTTSTSTSTRADIHIETTAGAGGAASAAAGGGMGGGVGGGVKVVKELQLATMNSSTPSTLQRYLQMAAIFLYMELLLWSVLLCPAIDIDVRWIPKSFFRSIRQSTCLVRLQRKPMAMLEVTYFTVVAMFGYFCGCGGPAGVGHAIYGKTLASFENAMMGVRQKFWWFCLMPWLITFTQYWLHNVGEFLLLFSDKNVYVTQNLYSTITLMLCYFIVQALLATEVAFMALQGWTTMRNINNENVEWEKRKRVFSDLMEETGFGLNK